MLVFAPVKGYLSEIFVSFQGEGLQAGRRQLFVRLAGCNLRCRYCDTPDSLERTARFRVDCPDSDPVELANPVAPAAVLSIALRLMEKASGSIDGAAFTGGEPLLQADFLAELLADARWPRPRLLETNGMLPERLRVALPVVDLVSMDIKLPSNTGEPQFWDAHSQFLEIGRGKTYVKVLIDASTDPHEVEQAALLVRDTAPETAVFLQPITGPDRRVSLSVSQLERCFAMLRQHVADVRVLPQTHKTIGIQ